MPLQTLRFKPGIIKDDTNYSSEGGWIDSDKIRFWNGKVEKIGGWQKLTPDQFEGRCRGLFSWRDNSDNALLIGLLSDMGLIIILTIGLTIYGLASFQDGGKLEGLESSKGWREFTSGFFIGAFGGDIVAFLLLANISFFA